MTGTLTAIGAELASEKAARNRGRVRGSGTGHPPKKALRVLGRMVGRESADTEEYIMRGLEYREKKGGSSKARKGLTFTLRAQT